MKYWRVFQRIEKNCRVSEYFVCIPEFLISQFLINQFLIKISLVIYFMKNKNPN